MSIQKIMVPFLEAEGGSLAFDAANLLAERFKAHLDTVHIRQSPNISTTGYYPYEVYIAPDIDAFVEKTARHAAMLKEKFAETCAKRNIHMIPDTQHGPEKGVTAYWHDITGLLPYDLGSRGRTADLCVFTKPMKSLKGFTQGIVEELLFQSGRPVLLVDEKKLTAYPETIMIAWNGSREAARAVGASMDILRQAKNVIVQSIGEIQMRSPSASDAANHLKMHGIHAIPSTVSIKKGEDAEDSFIHHVTKFDAEMIVMGAYSHSRMRQFVLGGFTRHMLHKTSIPVLMAH